MTVATVVLPSVEQSTPSVVIDELVVLSSVTSASISVGRVFSVVMSVVGTIVVASVKSAVDASVDTSVTGWAVVTSVDMPLVVDNFSVVSCTVVVGSVINVAAAGFNVVPALVVDSVQSGPWVVSPVGVPVVTSSGCVVSKQSAHANYKRLLDFLKPGGKDLPHGAVASVEV